MSDTPVVFAASAAQSLFDYRPRHVCTDENMNLVPCTTEWTSERCLTTSRAHRRVYRPPHVCTNDTRKHLKLCPTKRTSGRCLATRKAHLPVYHAALAICTHHTLVSAVLLNAFHVRPTYCLKRRSPCITASSLTTHLVSSVLLARYLAGITLLCHLTTYSSPSSTLTCSRPLAIHRHILVLSSL